MKRKWMIEGKIADDGGHDSQDNDQHNYGNDNEFPAEEPSVDEPQKRIPPPSTTTTAQGFLLVPRKASGMLLSAGGGLGTLARRFVFPPEIFASRITSHDHATRSARIFIRVCILLFSPSPLSLPTVLSNRHPLYMHLPHGIQRQENPLPKGS